MVEVYCCFRGAYCFHQQDHHRPNNGGSKRFWNVGKLLPDCTEQHPKKTSSCSRRENLKPHTESLLIKATRFTQIKKVNKKWRGQKCESSILFGTPSVPTSCTVVSITKCMNTSFPPYIADVVFNAKSIPLLFILHMTSKQHPIWNPFGLVYTRYASGQSTAGWWVWMHECVGLTN
jgi:hypothetical protein